MHARTGTRSDQKARLFVVRQRRCGRLELLIREEHVPIGIREEHQ